MLRILVVRLEGYVDTADAWSRGLRDEGHEVVVTGPEEAEVGAGDGASEGECEGEGGPDVEAVHAIATQEDVSIVVAPGAVREWAHRVKHALKADDIALAPPEADLGDLLDWVGRRQDR